MVEEKKFIRNIINADVDGLNGLVTYKIYSMYDVKGDDNFWSYEQTLLEEITYSFFEIDKLGGVGEVTSKLKNKYNIL